MARYTYDLAGNVLSVDRLGTPSVALLSAIPSRARIGDTISLSGKGFAATPAGNTVKINGIAAAVTAAASDRLAVTVPNGATSGSVTVTTSSGTATLAGVTIVANDKPVITDFNPKTAAPGTSVTLTVSNPDPELANNVVRIGGLLAAVTARTATTVTATVPQGAGSGALQLSTPGGSASGSAVLVIPPAPATPGNLGSAAPIPVGTATSVPVAAGKYVLRYFSANEGDRFAVVLSEGTIGGCGLNSWVFDERNRQTGSAECAGDGGWIETGPPSGPGLRSLLLHNSTGSAGTTNVTVYKVPADINAGVQPMTGAATTVTTVTPGQNGYVTFQGTAGQRVVIKSFDASSSFGCCYLAWELTAPDGSRVGDSQYPDTTLDTVTLPQTGTYTIRVDPHEGRVGSISFSAWTVPPDTNTGTLALNGTAKTITITNPGQNAFTTFTGTAGQRVIVQSSDTSASFGCCYLTWWLAGPDGTTVGSGQYPNMTLDTVVLPQSGTYRVIVDPNAELVGSITLAAWIVPADVNAGNLATNGTAKTVTITNPGQNAYMTFTGTTNQRLIIKSANASSSFGCCYLAWELTAPNGTRVGDSQYPDTTLDTITLPQTGTYTIRIDPNDGLVGSISFSAWTVPPDANTGTLPLNGTAKTITITNPGQNAYATFSGTAGRRLVVVSSNSSPEFGCCYMEWWITAPDGSVVESTQYPDATLDVTLSATGAYKLWLDPREALLGGSTFTATTPAAKRDRPTTNAPPKTAPHPTRGAADKIPVEDYFPPQPDKVVDLAIDSPNAATALPGGDPRTSAAWKPDTGSLAGKDWLTRLPTQEPVADLTADKGVTAIAGHVVGLDGATLAGIPVRVDGIRTTTDAQGRFLVRGVRANATTVVVDGYAADTAPAKYGTFRIRAKVVAGATTPLDATVWLPRLDTRHTQKITAPTAGETVLTTPDIPGLEVRLPAGSVVRDMNGAVVTELGITAIPLDRAPYPLPRNGIVPVYFTVQPGGASVFPQGASVVYPNYTRLPAGSAVDFWNYDPTDKGWYVYGHGTVTPDGKQVRPDDKTRLWTFDGSMFNTPGSPKPDNPKPPNGPGKQPGDSPNGPDGPDSPDAQPGSPPEGPDPESGDPVDLSTGLLTDSHTDLGLVDTMPVTLTRQYWQGDNHSREFGLNSGSDFNLLLASENQYQEVDVYTPDGAREHYVRTSPGTGYTGAVFGSVGSPGRFAASTIAQVDSEWVLSLSDGTKYFFPFYSRPRAIQDRNGNMITLVRATGSNDEVSRIISPSGRWISLEYDASARVTRAYDNIGRQVRYTYDAAGRLATVTDVAGKVTTYAYDASNRIRRITDARGIAYLDITYDANGRVARQNLADGGNYQFAYTLDTNGKISETRVTQPNGSVRRVTFDTNRQITTETVAHGTGLARTTIYVRGTDSRIDAIIDPYNRRTNYVYNGQQRVTAVTALVGTADQHTTGQVTYGPFDQPLTTTDAAGKTTTYTYDAKGNPLTVTDPLNRKSTMTWTSAGRVATVATPGGAVTTIAYEAGSPVSVKDPLGRTSTMFVDAAGRPVKETDPLGASTLTQYDAQNQPTAITDPNGGISRYAYDAGGNITTFTDQRGKVTRWSYDGQDRATSTTDPLNRTATTTFDAAGRPTASVSRAGLRTETAYDALDRPTKTRFGVTGATAQQSLVTYTYDALDRLTTLADSAGGTTTHTFDARDRVVSTTGPNGTVGHGYDAVGRQTSTTLPGLPSTTYGYDAAGWFTGVTRGTETVSIARDTTGRPTAVTLPGGWTQTYTHDAANQVTGIAYAQGGTAKGAIGYAYDPTGRLTSVTGTLAQTTLPAARGAQTYNDANQLVAPGVTYDNDGNLTADGATTYTWNARGELTGTGTGSYTYDATGKRSARTVGGVTTKFLYDGANAAAELDGAGALTASLLSGGVDQWFSRTKAGVTDTTLTDALGSPIALGRADGAIAANLASDPFGVPTTTGDKRGSDLGFTGRQDDGTGLMQYRGRYYSPATQRFVSEDPIGLAGGTNLYTYVENSPTNYTDPSGNNPSAGSPASGKSDTVASCNNQSLSGRKINWRGVGQRAKAIEVLKNISANCPNSVAAVALPAVRNVYEMLEEFQSGQIGDYYEKDVADLLGQPPTNKNLRKLAKVETKFWWSSRGSILGAAVPAKLRYRVLRANR